MNEGPVLCLRDVSFAYHGREPALSHISVDICRGERIAILGENGAGKSTFFLYINGVLKRQGVFITKVRKLLIRISICCVKKWESYFRMRTVR